MHIWDVRENCVALSDLENGKQFFFPVRFMGRETPCFCAANNNNEDMLVINLLRTRSKHFKDVTEFAKPGRERKDFILKTNKKWERRRQKNLNLQEGRRRAGVSYNPHHRKVEELCSHVWL